MSRLPTADELDAAWTAVRGRMEPSPIVERDGLFWKLETELPTGSFKVRGATVAAAALASDRGLVAASAGNHGLGLCWATAPDRTPLTIVVPRECPEVKRNKLAAFDHATIRVCEQPGYDAAEALARQIAEEEQRPFVSPFDHPLVMAGNGGTLLRELMEQLPDAGTIIVPVGGGGLLAGLVAARIQAARPRCGAVRGLARLLCKPPRPPRLHRLAARGERRRGARRRHRRRRCGGRARRGTPLPARLRGADHRRPHPALGAPRLEGRGQRGGR